MCRCGPVPLDETPVSAADGGGFRGQELLGAPGRFFSPRTSLEDGADEDVVDQYPDDAADERSDDRDPEVRAEGAGDGAGQGDVSPPREVREEPWSEVTSRVDGVT